MALDSVIHVDLYQKENRRKLAQSVSSGVILHEEMHLADNRHSFVYAGRSQEHGRVCVKVAVRTEDSSSCYDGLLTETYRLQTFAGRVPSELYVSPLQVEHVDDVVGLVFPRISGFTASKVHKRAAACKPTILQFSYRLLSDVLQFEEARFLLADLKPENVLITRNPDASYRHVYIDHESTLRFGSTLKNHASNLGRVSPWMLSFQSLQGEYDLKQHSFSCAVMIGYYGWRKHPYLSESCSVPDIAWAISDGTAFDSTVFKPSDEAPQEFLNLLKHMAAKNTANRISLRDAKVELEQIVAYQKSQARNQ